MELIAAVDSTGAESLVGSFVVVVVAGFLAVAGFRVARRKLGWRDKRRNLTGRRDNREYEWRWSTWQGGRLRCAYRYAMLPGRGPFLCDGPHARAHQVAHVLGGSSDPENIMCLCRRHNLAMKTQHHTLWWMGRALPGVGHALIARRLVHAEVVRRWFWRPPSGWRGATRKKS